MDKKRIVAELDKLNLMCYNDIRVRGCLLLELEIDM